MADNTEQKPGLSTLQILKDGTVVITDGSGAEIRMIGGTVVITCPGSMVKKPTGVDAEQN